MAASREHVDSKQKESSKETVQGEINFRLTVTPQAEMVPSLFANARGTLSGSADTRVGDSSTCHAHFKLKVVHCKSESNHSHFGSKYWMNLMLLACDRTVIRVEYSLHIGIRNSLLYSTHLTVGTHHGMVVDVDVNERIVCNGKYFYEEPQRESSILVRDMELIFEEHPYSDFTLFVGSERLPAHKVILAARSPVFKAMFDSPLTESETGQVEIEDVDYDVLKEMLRYMYTGKQPDLTCEMAERLLPAANKYALDELKTMCGEHMLGKLTVENVVGILILADLYSADNLKTAAQKFISQHKAYVKNKKEWKDMFRSHPELAIETVDIIFTE